MAVVARTEGPAPDLDLPWRAASIDLEHTPSSTETPRTVTGTAEGAPFGPSEALGPALKKTP